MCRAVEQDGHTQMCLAANLRVKRLSEDEDGNSSTSSCENNAVLNELRVALWQEKATSVLDRLKGESLIKGS